MTSKKSLLASTLIVVVFVALSSTVISEPIELNGTGEPLPTELTTIEYSDGNMTITFKENEMVLGQATLKSHKTYDEVLEITSGKSKIVVWYEFSEFRAIQKNALGEVEFIDLRKYILNAPDNKIVDMKDTNKYVVVNPNYLMPIQKDYNFVYLNNGNWLQYKSFDIPLEEIIVGIETDLKEGERIDVVFSILNNKLEKHAVVLGTSSGFVTETPSGDPDGLSTGLEDYAIAAKDTSPATAAKITEVGFYCGFAPDSGDVNLAVYSHDAGNNAPENILWTDILAHDGGTGWYIITDLDIEISPNKIYWLAGWATDNITVDRSSTGGRLARKYITTGLPDPWVDDQFFDNDTPAIYAVWEAGVTDSCTCAASGTWAITGGDTCTLTDTCDLAGDMHIQSGSLTIATGGLLVVPEANKLIIEDDQNLIIQGGEVIVR